MHTPRQRADYANGYYEGFRDASHGDPVEPGGDSAEFRAGQDAGAIDGALAVWLTAAEREQNIERGFVAWLRGAPSVTTVAVTTATRGRGRQAPPGCGIHTERREPDSDGA